jgi:DNA (cytosine-5)-methyltransferase 1
MMFLTGMRAAPESPWTFWMSLVKLLPIVSKLWSNSEMNHIELFAGCGGLCLGLESVGFELLMANELSPMAAETFAFNILNENLKDFPKDAKHTLWLSSQYSKGDMLKRLREDPREYPEKGFSDLQDDGGNLKGSLVIGDIRTLNTWVEDRKDVQQILKTGFGQGGVDLISGGPPCQSFSLAGLREKNNSKNSLPWEFAKFTALVQPKLVLLENVTGILRPFKDGDKKYYAWFEVAKAFAKIGYIPLTLHINAKYVGVAQNRPRFILLGVRSDVFDIIKKKFNASENELFSSSLSFYNKLKAKKSVNLCDLTVHDLNKGDKREFELFENSFLSPLVVKKEKFTSVREAIGDLCEDSLHRSKPSEFVLGLEKTFNKFINNQPFEDSARRSPRVQYARVKERFRIYQVIASIDSNTKKSILRVLSGKQDEIDREAWGKVKNKKFLLQDGKLGTFRDKKSFELFLRQHVTKKQIQRALVANEPAPAALSIPDDACHYVELRTLSAREMARIQSFPDSFAFRSKMTTGGQNRKFEVPVYTQIGNAVPVLMARALGECARTLLNKLQ